MIYLVLGCCVWLIEEWILYHFDRVMFGSWGFCVNVGLLFLGHMAGFLRFGSIALRLQFLSLPSH